ncbi:MAG: YCF48-related protein [Burkholderiales bacterium]
MRTLSLVGTVVAAVAVAAFSAAVSHADPLQRPARTSALAPQRLVTSVTAIGPQRLIAVGQRGHLLLSEDSGASWRQGALPLSSDLSAVQFVDAQHGYAVGHDGVVLGSTDGGTQWTKLLDGKAANALALEQLRQSPGPEQERLLVEAQRNVDSGPDKPLLDVYFSSPQEGFVVGAYNLIFQTRDGGKSWQSWYDRSDNSDKLFNLYGIRSHQGQLFVVGEAGLLMRLDTARQRFVRIDTGYKGSFFGLLDAGNALIAYGMRGNAVISRDGGKQWTPLQSGLQASITASAKGADGSLWLADQMGHVSVSRDGGQRFTEVKLPFNMPLAAIYVTPTTLVLAGARGIRSVPLPKE